MNKLIIGENIWRLRKLKKITQEQLGEYIGVSKGAISKWESGVSYPDIELLPVLARFFEISIDELLNFNSKISKELEDEIYLECKNAINEEHTENGIELCKSYLIKYTNNYDLKFKLVALMTIGCAFIKNEEEIKRIYGKAINIYEEIVNNSLNEEIVELSKLQLSMYYSTFEDYDKSLDILDNMKKSICNINTMKAKIYIKSNDLNQGRKLYQESFLDSMIEVQEILYGLAFSYYKDDIKLAERYMDLRLKMNCLSDGNSLNGTFDHYIRLSEFYAHHEDIDKCLDAIKKAINSMSLNNDDAQNTWYFDEIDLGKYSSSTTQISNIVISVLDKDEYNFLRKNNEFINLKNKIRKIKFK